MTDPIIKYDKYIIFHNFEELTHSQWSLSFSEGALRIGEAMLLSVLSNDLIYREWIKVLEMMIANYI